MIIDALRSIRTALEAETPPEPGASPEANWQYVWHQLLAAMLRPRFWVVAVVVAMVLQVLER